MTEEKVNYSLYTVEDSTSQKMVHVFQTSKSRWTTDELNDLADTIKSYVYDEDMKELKRMGRHDMVGIRR